VSFVAGLILFVVVIGILDARDSTRPSALPPCVIGLTAVLICR
jgi:hypothetical protein